MIRKITTIFVALFCFSFTMSAQDSGTVGTAEIDANYCLTLDDSAPLTTYYAADISALGFESELDAKNVFGTKSNNLITYSVDFENNQVIAQLHAERLSAPKSLAWWSEYLLNTCSLY